MTTEEMKALPVGARVKSVQTGREFEKIEDVSNDVYRCYFKKIGKRGLSSGFTKFHGGRIEVVKC